MSRRPAAAPGSVKVATWVGVKPVVVCDGGPLDRRWYFEADWVEKVRVAQAMFDGGGQGRSDCQDYVLTAREMPHPKEPVTGRVLRWTGSRS